MKILLRIAAIAAILAIGRFAMVSAQQMAYPGDLVFESPGLNTALLLDRGVNIYSRQTFDAPPFNLNMYTPLYFALVSSIPGFSESPLPTGRAVSMFFLVCALCLLILSWRGPNRMLWGTVGAGWILMFYPYHINSAFFRMETMALFWSAAAVTILIRRAPSGAAVGLSAGCVFLGIMTKQSYVAAPVACFLYLLWRRPRAAFGFALWSMALFGVSFGVLNHITAGGFLWSVLSAPQVPFRFWQFVEIWSEMDTAAFNLLIAAAAFACFSMIRRSGLDKSLVAPAPSLAPVPQGFPSVTTLPPSGRSEDSPQIWGERLIAIYFLTSWVWAVAGTAKLGASYNYFIEPIFVSVWSLSIWLGNRERLRQGRMVMASLAILSAVLVWEGTLSLSSGAMPPGWHPYEQYMRLRDEMESLRLPKTEKILNLATHRVSLSIGKDLYLNDPFLYALLWNTGRLSNRSILESLDRGYFDLVVVGRGTRPSPVADPTPLGEIFLKIFERYDLKAEGTLAYYAPKSRAENSP